MEKLTLKMYELKPFEFELNGFVNQETGEVVKKGFLQEDLSMGIKLPLERFAVIVAEELAFVEKKRIDLVKKYGVADEQGNLQVPDGHEAFAKEFDELMISEKEVEFAPLNAKDIAGLKSENRYHMILTKLVK
jgi:hypothetical protein